MNIFWTMGDMKTLYIWKKFRMFQTFRWKNFSDRKNSSRRTPRLWRQNVKFHFLTIFRKSSGCKKVRPSNFAEKFWKEIWTVFPQKMTKNSSRRTPRRNFDHFFKHFWKKNSKNDENWHFAKFGCRGRSAFGIGAKHI